MNAYDTMRNQQKNEVQSLMAVSKHLGSMAFNASDSFRREKGSTLKTDQNFNEVMQKLMNPQVQSNLDSLIKEQLEQIQAMNKSQKMIQNALAQQPASNDAKPDDYNPQFEKSLSSETKMVMVGENPNLYLINNEEQLSPSKVQQKQEIA